MTAIEQADAVSTLIMLDIGTTMVFYGLIFTGLCLIVRQVVQSTGG